MEEPCADRILGAEDAGEDEEHRDEVHRAEGLVEEGDAEQDSHHRVDEADDRRRCRPEEGKAPEPEHVGQTAAEQSEVGERSDGG